MTLLLRPSFKQANMAPQKSENPYIREISELHLKIKQSMEELHRTLKKIEELSEQTSTISPSESMVRVISLSNAHRKISHIYKNDRFIFLQKTQQYLSKHKVNKMALCHTLFPNSDEHRGKFRQIINNLIKVSPSKKLSDIEEEDLNFESCNNPTYHQPSHENVEELADSKCQFSSLEDPQNYSSKKLKRSFSNFNEN